MKTLTRDALNKCHLFRLILVMGSCFAFLLRAVPSKASFFHRFLSVGSGLDAGSPFPLFLKISFKPMIIFLQNLSKLKSETM